MPPRRPPQAHEENERNAHDQWSSLVSKLGGPGAASRASGNGVASGVPGGDPIADGGGGGVQPLPPRSVGMGYSCSDSARWGAADAEDAAPAAGHAKAFV